MALPLSSARAIAVFSFALNICAQVYGSVASPSVKAVHDAHLSFFSPDPYFVAAFFALVLLVHGVWLHALCTLDVARQVESSGMLAYVPVFVLGNFCLVAWMLCWTAERLRAAEAFVVLNTAAQLWFLLTRLPPLQAAGSRASLLTHLANKAATGLAIIDVLHNGSVAFFEGSVPNMLVKVATVLGFTMAALESDWVLGAALVYDLLALAFGQRGYSTDARWGGALLGNAISTAVIVAVKNWFWPPYPRAPDKPVEGSERDFAHE